MGDSTKALWTRDNPKMTAKTSGGKTSGDSKANTSNKATLPVSKSLNSKQSK